MAEQAGTEGTEGQGAEGTGTEGQGAQVTPAELAAKAAAAKAQQAQQTQEGEGSDPTEWPEEARREIARLRKENGDARMNAKQKAAEEARTALLKEVMGVLDPTSTEEATPEALLARVQTTEVERDKAVVAAALVREAWEQGVDPARLEYLQFLVTRREDYATLSPANQGWGDTLKSMVTEVVASDRTLKATGAQKGTGDGQFGGAGDTPSITKEQFASMSMQERTALYLNDRATYDRLVNA